MHTAVLKQAYVRRVAMAALLKNDQAFEALMDKLKNAYTRGWTEQSKTAIAAALDRLREMDPAQFRQAEADTILKVLESRMGGDAMQAALHGPVMDLTEPLWKLGAVEVGKTTGVDIVFGLPDLDSLAVVERGNLFWVGQHWNSFTHEKFYGALTEYFDKGMTREQLAARMADDFASLSERGSVYWEMVADHAATKTREIGRVTGYERAGVRRVRIRAHIDENTTEICRRLNGKVIRVSRMQRQRDRYLDAIAHMDTERAKKVWPMMGDKQAEKIKDQVPANVGMPPYHFRCRTITVVEFSRKS